MSFHRVEKGKCIKQIIQKKVLEETIENTHELDESYEQVLSTEVLNPEVCCQAGGKDIFMLAACYVRLTVEKKYDFTDG